MQTFIDTATQKVYQYEDDVVVTLKNGVYSFSTSFGTSLNTPSTLQPYTIPAPTPAQLLSEAQTAQIASLQAAFNTAMVAPVTVTLASGTSYSFATDTQSLKNLNEAISANISNATWTPNFRHRSRSQNLSDLRVKVLNIWHLERLHPLCYGM